MYPFIMLVAYCAVCYWMNVCTIDVHLLYVCVDIVYVQMYIYISIYVMFILPHPPSYDVAKIQTVM